MLVQQRCRTVCIRTWSIGLDYIARGSNFISISYIIMNNICACSTKMSYGMHQNLINWTRLYCSWQQFHLYFLYNYEQYMCLFNKDVVRYASELDQLEAIIIYSVPVKSSSRRIVASSRRLYYYYYDNKNNQKWFKILFYCLLYMLVLFYSLYLA